MQLFQHHGLREEFLGPGPECLQDRLAVAAGADRQDRQSGKLALQLLNQLQGLGLVGIEGDDHQVGHRLPGHVDEELIARALSFEPDRLDAQQQIAKRLACGIGGIHNRDPLHVLHEPPPLQEKEPKL